MRSLFSDPERRKLIGQLIRYGITGVMTTAVNVGVYHLMLDWLKLWPNVAWTIGFVVAFAVAYPAHSRYSFRDHGTRDNLLQSVWRFFLVSLVGFVLNNFWVWSLVGYLKLPSWAPDIPVLFVTPLLVFAINRKWVFN